MFIRSSRVFIKSLLKLKNMIFFKIKIKQSGCTKVYTSTSDVMTHKKFHVKDEELAKNGFQRYRANERCNYKDCPFNDMKTTHYHCTLVILIL